MQKVNLLNSRCANTETWTVNAFMRSAGDAKQPDCVVFHHHCDDDDDDCDDNESVSLHQKSKS